MIPQLLLITSIALPYTSPAPLPPPPPPALAGPDRGVRIDSSTDTAPVIVPTPPRFLEASDLPGGEWVPYQVDARLPGLCGFQLPDQLTSGFFRKGVIVRSWVAELATRQQAAAAWRANQKAARSCKDVEGVGIDTSTLVTGKLVGMPTFGFDIHAARRIIGGYIFMLRGRRVGEVSVIAQHLNAVDRRRMLLAVTLAQAAKLR